MSKLTANLKGLSGPQIAVAIMLFLILAVLIFAVLSFTFMIAWNASVAPVLGYQVIGFSEAWWFLGLIATVRFIMIWGSK